MWEAFPGLCVGLSWCVLLIDELVVDCVVVVVDEDRVVLLVLFWIDSLGVSWFVGAWVLSWLSLIVAFVFVYCGDECVDCGEFVVEQCEVLECVVEPA